MTSIVIIVGGILTIFLLLNAAFSFLQRRESTLSWLRFDAAVICCLITVSLLNLLRVLNIS